MRTDLYGLVHKAQRYHLFHVAQWLGRADLDDLNTRIEIGERVREILSMLNDHARNEERYIHPLFARVGDGAKALESEHRSLEERMHELGTLVDSGRFNEIYGALMRLIGVYLLHIDAEERAQVEWIWPRYQDEELVAVFLRFKAERPAAEARDDFARFLPALSVPELARMLSGMRSGLPALEWQVIREQARDGLGPDRWAELETQLG